MAEISKYELLMLQLFFPYGRCQAVCSVTQDGFPELKLTLGWA